MKKLFCVLVALFVVMAALPVFATPAASGDVANDYYAVPYKDGVLISHNGGEMVWCELYMTPEGGEQGMYNRGSISGNNHIRNNAFINGDSQFNKEGVVFDNTPGKTYTFKIVGTPDGSSWKTVVSAFTYTVPANPTLTVASADLTNTLTYTLVNNGKGGVIYRYDSEAKAKLGGNDYDAKIDITYGGDPVVDTVDAAGTYYYTIKQEGISDTPGLVASRISNNQVANTSIFNFIVEEGDNNSFILTGTKNDAGFPDGHSRAWTTAKMVDLVKATAANTAEGEYIPSIADSSTWYSFVKSLDGVTDSNGAFSISAGVTFTLDGTDTFDFNGSNAIASTKLQRGKAYRLHLTSKFSPDPDNVKWDNEAIGFVIPELTVVSATNTAPAPAPESWITDMEVAGEGVVDIKISIPDGTWWSEVSIFTHEPPDPRTIIDNKLDRGERNAVIVGNWVGTIGPNNTDYDLPFAFVDGTTYYVYVSRCVNPNGSTVDEVWDINPVAYRFTYNAPQATPAPTPAPTPTVVPDDGDNGTADISVVLYAITALAGAGAVVAIKRKKA